MPQFHIEQIALCPTNPATAIALLTDMGLADWARDHVVAHGHVYGMTPDLNEADLAFNYQATRGVAYLDDGSILGDATLSRKPLELEVLHYTAGDNWMNYNEPSVSHLGMHCTEEELAAWREFFAARHIDVAQEVDTKSHTNPAIAGKRWYKYVIFNTREILSVDVKFIVRLETSAVPGGV